MLKLETQLPVRESREINATGTNTIRECQKLCPECIAIRQYVKGASNAELLKWAINAGLEAKVKDGVLCFAFEKDTKEQTDRIFVLVGMRVLFGTENTFGNTGWTYRLQAHIGKTAPR